MDYPARRLRFRFGVVLMLPVPIIIVMLLFFTFVHNAFLLFYLSYSYLSVFWRVAEPASYDSVPDNPGLLPSRMNNPDFREVSRAATDLAFLQNRRMLLRTKS
jgi:hypothetical protein